MSISRKCSYLPSEKKIVIFSGAGLDASSGVKTFRDQNGLWNDHKVEDICNIDSWEKNYDLVHEFYNARRLELGKAEINPAHESIKRIIQKYGEKTVFNLTMNVSNFFERLNTKSMHLHGDLTKVQCKDCGFKKDVGCEEFDYKNFVCSKCGCTKSKPDVVFFGESTGMYTYLERAIEYLENPRSIIIVVGTTGQVVDISRRIKEYNCKKILCYKEHSEFMNENQFDEVYMESAETAMPKIEKLIEDNF